MRTDEKGTDFETVHCRKKEDERLREKKEPDSGCKVNNGEEYDNNPTRILSNPKPDPVQKSYHIIQTQTNLN